MSDVKYYCEKCGSLCRWTKKRSRGFDPETGKRRPDYQVTCPNYKWYSSVHFNESVCKDIEGNFFYGSSNEFGPFYIKPKSKKSNE